jgi:hypothetical protein
VRPVNRTTLAQLGGRGKRKGQLPLPGAPLCPRRGKTMPTLATSELLRWTGLVLSVPPPAAWIVRPEPRGRLVARFVLPLSLCRNRNAATVPGWQRAKDRAAILSLLKAQLRTQAYWRTRALPLPGRPFLRAIRFSSVESDPSSDGAKVPIDCLCPSRKRAGKVIEGLGLIAGDRGSQLERDEHYEPAPPGKGCLLIELWDGSDACPF